MINPQVDKDTVLVIRTDGSREVLKITKGTLLKTVHSAIGAETLDMARIGKADDTDLVMAVDDAGYETEEINHGGGRFELRPIRARKPYNQTATWLYHAICRPGTTHQIVGDVAIFHDGDV
jgi:hypothetical protein